MALLITTAGLWSGDTDSHVPTVVNRSSHTVVVLAGMDQLHPWVTLEPGESAHADRPFMSTDGCYHGMQLEARTTDGRVIGTLATFCTNDRWEITDAGAARAEGS